MLDDTKIGLVLGVPFGGRPVVPQWAVRFGSLQWPLNTGRAICAIYNQPIAEARIQIVEGAIAKGAKYVAMLDDDTEPPLDWLIRATSILGQYEPEGFRVVGGIYVARTDHPQPIVYRGNSQGAFWDWKAGEVFECDGIGTGCILISTEVFKHLPRPWFKTVAEHYSPGTRPTIGNFISDDLWFCELVRKAGFKILADGGVLCRHWDWKTGKAYQLPADSYPMRGRSPAEMALKLGNQDSLLSRIAHADPSLCVESFQIEARKMLEHPDDWAGTLPCATQELPPQPDPSSNWLTEGERAWLTQQAVSRKFIVEIGSHVGTSTRVLADATQGRVLAVDDWKGPRDSNRVAPGDYYEEFCSNLADHLRTGRVAALRMDHGTFAEQLDVAVIYRDCDMVFIDGGHKYAEVKRDIAGWLKVPGKRLLCGHDVNMRGVFDAVNEMLPECANVPGTTLWYAQVDVPKSAEAPETQKEWRV